MTRHALRLNPRAPLRVVVVGAGGTGSAVTALLSDLHKALVALGGQGLVVTLFDPAAITSVNVARQNFSPAEVGRNKATSLMTRVNYTLGTGWRGVPDALSGAELQRVQPDIVITCTDTKRSRREIGAMLTRQQVTYWVDCGNEAFTGQMLLSEPGRAGPHLPTPLETHGKHLEGNAEVGASCSALEALTRQDLMINREVALHAVRLLWRLLCDGVTSTRGVYIDTREGLVMPVPVQPGMVDPRALSVGLIPDEVRAAEVVPDAPAPARKARRKRSALPVPAPTQPAAASD